MQKYNSFVFNNISPPDWKRAVVPERAAGLYRKYLLEPKENQPTLKFRIDIRADGEDQEGQIIQFYKAPKVDWARPLQCRLEGNTM